MAAFDRLSEEVTVNKKSPWALQLNKVAVKVRVATTGAVKSKVHPVMVMVPGCINSFEVKDKGVLAFILVLMGTGGDNKGPTES